MQASAFENGDRIESSPDVQTTLGLVNIPKNFASGTGAEMFTRLKDVDGLWHRNSDPGKHKFVLDRMVGEPGGELLFHTQVAAL